MMQRWRPVGPLRSALEGEEDNRDDGVDDERAYGGVNDVTDCAVGGPEETAVEKEKGEFDKEEGDEVVNLVGEDELVEESALNLRIYRKGLTLSVNTTFFSTVKNSRKVLFANVSMRCMPITPCLIPMIQATVPPSINNPLATMSQSEISMPLLINFLVASLVDIMKRANVVDAMLKAVRKSPRFGGT